MKHKRTLRRGLSILLSLVMCLTLLPATALAEGTETETADFTAANISDQLTRLTSGGGEAKWEDNTLTLTNVNFTTSAATAVELPDGATIKLVGANTITSTSSSTDTSYSCGIDVRGNLTIEGSGTLTVTGGAAAQNSIGIYTFLGDVTICGGAVTAEGGAANYSYGIMADLSDVTIEGGTVKATGDTAGNSSYGIYASCDYDFEQGVIIAGNVKISGSAEVTAKGGEAKNGSSYGIYAEGNADISGGTVTATADEAVDYSIGIWSGKGVTISDLAEVTAKSDEAVSSSYGICTYDGDVTISGGTVEAIGDTADNYSYGIYAYTGNVTISGEDTDVTVKSGAATESDDDSDSESIGIIARQNVTIEGGTVTATSSTAGQYSTGITAINGNVIISGGTVEVTGGKVTRADGESYGIESYNSKTIIISGGHVTAQTLAEESTTTTRRALNVEPDLSGYTNCIWRTSSNGSFAAAAYEYSDTHTYVEFSNGKTFTNYGVTVNDVAVTSLNKDDVLGNGKVQYDPDTNTLYAENLYAANLTVAGNGSTDVAISSTSAAPAVGTLTVTDAQDVTVTASGTMATTGKAEITCSGNVTITGAVTGALTVTGAQDVTVTAGSGSQVIAGNTTINCFGNVKIVCTSSGMAVTGSLTVTGAKDVTVTVNSCNPAIGGAADITCSGDVTISNGSGKAVNGTLKYENAGKHSYTVETGTSLDNLTESVPMEAGETFGPAALDASAVKITVAHIAGEWQSSKTQHWQVCTACGDEFNRADHTFSSRTCTVCGYTKPSTSSSSGSTTYSITVESAKHGTVTLNPKTAAKGAVVTITVDPDEGYILDELTVTDKNGKEIALTDKGSGKFTFKMPASKVTVEASFVKETARDNTIVLTLGSNTATVFGQTVVNDVAPVARNNRTMLPIRFVAEALGAQVDWNADLQKVTISKPDLLIEIYLGSATAYVNGEAVELDVVAYAENNRTYLPLRFVAENLGATVLWDASTQSITITP